MKIITMLKGPETRPSDDFYEWIVGKHLPMVKAGAPSFRGGVLRRTLPAPPTSRAPSNGSAFAEADPGLSFDVLIEMWLPSCEDFRREVLPTEQALRDLGCRFASYGVLPRLQKDPRMAEGGLTGRRPELTYVLSMKWSTSVSADFASKEWAEHTAVALRCQPAMSRYEQNLVTETISWTKGVSLIDAYADFSFPLVEDFVSRFIVTREELQDMWGLVQAFSPAVLGDAEPF